MPRKIMSALRDSRKSLQGTRLVLACLMPLWLLRAVAAPLPAAWDEYQVIMWVGDSAFKKPEKLPVFFDRLRELGVTAGMVYGEASSSPFLNARLPYYLENMVNRGLCLKWNSSVTNWDRFVTDWAKHGRPVSAMTRDYCFDDPQWIDEAGSQMRKLALRHAANRPLLYNLRDELSVTVSANPFDYDFNPLTLAAFRTWLKPQYPTLDRLNQEWETAFASWQEVTPFTTDEIKARMGSGKASRGQRPSWGDVAAQKFDLKAARKELTRWNFAPWSDFRSYMDHSLASTITQLRQAAVKVDARTPVGVEGTQMPHAFGGYDLWRLSQAIDWVEPYDIGNAREIFGSFMPGKLLLTTVFESETRKASRRLWHLLLEGDRGCIIWWSEDCFNWQSPACELTVKAKALQPVLQELRRPLARLFMRAERLRDPIYLHYSQASIQADWLIESTVDGATWVRRFSSFEADHNRQVKARNAWLKAFQDLGWSPQFLSAAQVESGMLRSNEQTVLVLPTSWALSQREETELERFLTRTNRDPVVFFDGTPGVFNGHGRLRKTCLLEQYAPAMLWSATNCFCVSADGTPAAREFDPAQIAQARRGPGTNDFPAWIAGRLSGREPEIRVPADKQVRVHRFAIAQGRLVAFERNIDYHVSEDLKQAGGNEAFEQTVTLEARVHGRHHIYELRSGKYLGFSNRINFSLEPWAPALFALTREPLPAGDPVMHLMKD